MSSDPMSSDDCPAVRDDLVAFVDGALEPAHAARIERHLAACAPCAKDRQLLVASWRALETLPALEVRPGLLQKIETGILAQAEAPALKVVAGGRSATAFRWLSAAAVFLLCVGVGWWAASPGGEDDVAVGPATERRATETPSTEPPRVPPRLPAQTETPAQTERPATEQRAPALKADEELVENLDVLLALAEEQGDEELVRDAAEALADELADLDPEELDGA